MSFNDPSTSGESAFYDIREKHIRGSEPTHSGGIENDELCAMEQTHTVRVEGQIRLG